MRHLLVKAFEFSVKSQNYSKGRPMLREYVVGLIMGALMFAWNGTSYAADTASANHVKEALSQVKAAKEQGKMGHADVLVEHAKAALTQVEAAQKASANPNIIEATTALNEAIEQGKAGHTDASTVALEKAEIHLEGAAWDRPGGCPEGRPCEGEDGKEHKK